MSVDMPKTRAPTFQESVTAATPGDPHLERCIQCGTCGGSCPSGPDMDHTPRAIFAMIDAGWEDEVLHSNTPWYCVSCYFCTVRCPQEIHITDVMYTLKRMAVQRGLFRELDVGNAPEFSETFIDMVENYGRAFELGLVTRHYLRHRPLDAVKKAGLGLGMFSKGRMDLMPKRIKDMDQLKTILAKAQDLEKKYAERKPVEVAA
jgi:quinone-modifying oxidoreductase, subunit QmoC